MWNEIVQKDIGIVMLHLVSIYFVIMLRQHPGVFTNIFYFLLLLSHSHFIRYILVLFLGINNFPFNEIFLTTTAFWFIYFLRFQKQCSCNHHLPYWPVPAYVPQHAASKHHRPNLPCTMCAGWRNAIHWKWSWPFGISKMWWPKRRQPCKNSMAQWKCNNIRWYPVKWQRVWIAESWACSPKRQQMFKMFIYNFTLYFFGR